MKQSGVKRGVRTIPSGKIFDLRRQIDYIDGAIVSLLARRNELAQAILNLKRQQGKAAYSPEREGEIIARVRELAVDRGLDSTGISHIFEAILRQFVQPDNSTSAKAADNSGQNTTTEGDQII